MYQPKAFQPERLYIFPFEIDIYTRIVLNLKQ
jgi:hypothetical protein